MRPCMRGTRVRLDFDKSYDALGQVLKIAKEISLAPETGSAIQTT
jgi:hypothetical protein